LQPLIKVAVVIVKTIKRIFNLIYIEIVIRKEGASGYCKI